MTLFSKSASMPNERSDSDSETNEPDPRTYKVTIIPLFFLFFLLA